MKVIPVNNKVVLIRHWLKWYKVQRGFEDWRKLPIGRRYVKKRQIQDIQNSLDKSTK